MQKKVGANVYYLSTISLPGGCICLSVCLSVNLWCLYDMEISCKLYICLPVSLPFALLVYLY